MIENKAAQEKISSKPPILLQGDLTGMPTRTKILSFPLLKPFILSARAYYSGNFPEELQSLLSKYPEAGVLEAVGHRDYTDIFPLGISNRFELDLINDKLPSDQQFKGARMPIAMSVSSGHQGPWLQILNGLIYSSGIYDYYGLSPVDTITPGDIRQRKMKRQGKRCIQEPIDSNKSIIASEEIKQKRIKRIDSSTQKLVDARNDGFAIALFTEGTVKASRTNPETKHIYGIQNIGETNLRFLLPRIITEERPLPLIVIPKGLDIEANTIHPKYKVLTNKAIAAVFRIREAPRAVVNVGLPFVLTWEDVRNGHVKDSAYRIMSTIASLTPEYARGDYR